MSLNSWTENAARGALTTYAGFQETNANRISAIATRLTWGKDDLYKKRANSITESTTEAYTKKDALQAQADQNQIIEACLIH